MAENIAKKEDYKGWKRWRPTSEEWLELYANKKVPFELLENEYLIVETEDGCTTYYCYEAGSLRKFTGSSIKTFKDTTPVVLCDMGEEHKSTYKEKKDHYNSKGKSVVITPRNNEQVCAFDLIKDPSKTIKLITGHWGTGKAQPLTTIIPTPEGEKFLGDIKPGDFVFDRLGNPTKVLQVFPQGKLDVYRVTLADGRSTLCGPEHLWTVKSHSGKKSTLKTVTTAEMFERGIGKPNFNSKYNDYYIDYQWHIPMNEAVNYAPVNLPVDPYVVGCFLGDGCCTSLPLTISSADEFIPQEIARLLGSESACENSANYNWQFRLPTCEQDAKHKNFQTKTLFEAVPELCTNSHLKRIPAIYFQGSVTERYSLLQGLLDTDGSVSKVKAKISFASCNKGLCEDIIKLCSGLGLRATLSTYYRASRDVYEYSVHITAKPEDKLKLFRLPRKLARVQECLKGKVANETLNKSWGRFITITNIEKLDYQDEMVCIYVDNDEHLYLTNDYIVTHNTMILVNAALEALSQGRFDRIVWIRNNVEVKNTKDLGALPGNVLDKLLPFLGPFVDHAGAASVKTMLTKGTLVVEPLQSLRGRNLERTLIMCSEAENLTKEHLQLIIARAAEGSEVWFDADNRQRDSAVFEASRGIETLIECLAGEKLFGYVNLIKSERSATAALADKIC